jgi:cell division protein FtsZ
VVIEEGFSHLTWLAQSSRSQTHESDASGSAPEQFRPAPPAEIRRAGRRMPEVEDFPPLAQREYRAKIGWGAGAFGGSGSDAPAQAEPPRRSLLQRIIDRARGTEEVAAPDPALHGFSESRHVAHAPVEDQGWLDDDEDASDTDESGEHRHPLPDFFNRLRK